MRKLPIVGGFALSLVAATSVFAATPRTDTDVVTVDRDTVAPVVEVAPTVDTDTAALKTFGHTSFKSGAVSGTATISRATDYSAVHIVIKASGIANDASLAARLIARTSAGKYVSTISMTRFEAATSGGTERITWLLGSSSRQALEVAIAAGDKIYFRLTDGTTMATGLLH